MKKGLVYILVILILANFHCMRFRLVMPGSGEILASCKASLEESSGDSVELKQGRILLKENLLLFEHRGEIKSFPYSDMLTIEVDETSLDGIPKIPGYAFTENEKKKSAFLAIGLLLLVAALIVIFYVLVPHAGIDMNIHFNSDSGRDMATFRLNHGELAKIYPLLMEKVDR